MMAHASQPQPSLHIPRREGLPAARTAALELLGDAINRDLA